MFPVLLSIATLLTVSSFDKMMASNPKIEESKSDEKKEDKESLITHEYQSVKTDSSKSLSSSISGDMEHDGNIINVNFPAPEPLDVFISDLPKCMDFTSLNQMTRLRADRSPELLQSITLLDSHFRDFTYTPTGKGVSEQFNNLLRAIQDLKRRENNSTQEMAEISIFAANQNITLPVAEYLRASLDYFDADSDPKRSNSTMTTAAILRNFVVFLDQTNAPSIALPLSKETLPGICDRIAEISCTIHGTLLIKLADKMKNETMSSIGTDKKKKCDTSTMLNLLAQSPTITNKFISKNANPYHKQQNQEHSESSFLWLPAAQAAECISFDCSNLISTDFDVINKGAIDWTILASILLTNKGITYDGGSISEYALNKQRYLFSTNLLIQNCFEYMNDSGAKLDHLLNSGSELLNSIRSLIHASSKDYYQLGILLDASLVNYLMHTMVSLKIQGNARFDYKSEMINGIATMYTKKYIIAPVAALAIGHVYSTHFSNPESFGDCTTRIQNIRNLIPTSCLLTCTRDQQIFQEIFPVLFGIGGADNLLRTFNITYALGIFIASSVTTGVALLPDSIAPEFPIRKIFDLIRGLIPSISSTIFFTSCNPSSYVGEENSDICTLINLLPEPLVDNLGEYPRNVAKIVSSLITATALIAIGTEAGNVISRTEMKKYNELAEQLSNIVDYSTNLRLVSDLASVVTLINEYITYSDLEQAVDSYNLDSGTTIANIYKDIENLCFKAADLSANLSSQSIGAEIVLSEVRNQ